MIKGQLGRVAVIGGSEDYTGAPYFSAMASARLGADMVGPCITFKHHNSFKAFRLRRSKQKLTLFAVPRYLRAHRCCGHQDLLA